MKKLLSIAVAIALAFCVAGCSSGPMAGVNVTDYERMNGLYPNIPAIIQALKDDVWVNERHNDFEYDQFVEDLSLIDFDYDSGYMYISGLTGGYGSFSASISAHGLKDMSEIYGRYVSVLIETDPIKCEIDENGNELSKATGLILGNLRDQNVQDRLRDELRIRQEYIPEIIGFDEEDALSLLEELGIPRDTVVDVHQAFFRSPGSSILPSLTGEPNSSDPGATTQLWIGTGTYQYQMQATYIGNGYPVAIQLSAWQGYSLSLMETEAFDGVEEKRKLSISMPASHIRISFDLSGKQSDELLSEGEGRSKAPFTDNDTYPFDFTEVDKLAEIL